VVVPTSCANDTWAIRSPANTAINVCNFILKMVFSSLGGKGSKKFYTK